MPHERSGLPSSDFLSTSPTLDIPSDPLCFSSPHNLPYREANHNDRHNSDSNSTSHLNVTPPRSRSRADDLWDVARKRPRQSSDPPKSEAPASIDGDFDRVGGREPERLVPPSQFASNPGPSVFVFKRKHPSTSLICFVFPSGSFLDIIPLRRPSRDYFF
jgi:hypothetical protein